MSKMKPEVAKRRIESFEKRFGKAHLYLAYHAAFPLSLTPDLLYRLWANFQRNIYGEVLGIPWIAVADLLLSSLCDEVGHELYEMDLAVRNVLLSRLKEDEKFGQQRINELSDLLLEYVRQQLLSDDPDIRDFAQVQQWTALAYVRPSEAASELALAFSKLDDKDAAELVRMALLTETFAEPLAEFQPLLIYARGMENFARGKLEVAKAELGKVLDERNQIKIAAVNLPVPEQIKVNQKKRKLTKKFIISVQKPLAVVMEIIALVGIGLSLVSTQKVFDAECKVGIKISRGECTLFPNIKNPAREQGIQAFQQGKYFYALQDFQTAIAANRSDPEVLIYYNNARAEQQGSPFKIAVVVPAKQEDKEKQDQAQEILRGVAQAQNQFNEKGGLNNQLLEVAIACDDDNKPDIAKKVAEELVKDPSVLAVIGYNSSDATKAALDTYKQAELALISPTSTSTWLTNNGHGGFFRTVPSDAVTGEKLATYVNKKLGLNNVVIFDNPESSYSRSLTEAFTRKFEEKQGDKVVRKINLTDSKLDVEAQVAKSVYRKEYSAQAVVLFPDTQTTAVALKVATAVAKTNVRIKGQPLPGLKELKLLGGDALYSDTTLQEGSNNVEGMTLGVPWFREAPQSKNFAQAAQKQWGGNISWRTATSFDATQALIKTLSRNASKSTVMEKLPDVKILPSETSGETLQFDQEGESQNKPVLVKVVGGKFELVPE